ncbi:MULTISPECIES: transporter substrate-binding domain-containing protein [Bacillus]|jgi:polar amino acid transport system substrate-binding protein|uniref:Glutamine ABC transporter, glutamine-binding protein n=2 Tax=Bacillus cereus group TaxID=86661 RepID=Q73DV1_BACC1|nr:MULTISPECIES: transporter substrate-binding domain-containing protein [Bacillus]AAS39544.1 glutamine ABC transporter, glutamine-binding protein [Bacillus cereus ATCC 10987]AIE78086.1 glutamine ABC transporter, glutamine-binding protein [Bacillus cereus]KMQ31774.1 glutamine ABC transporter substrate-binding protein [Bacillus cereus]KXY71036.1 glutamine ABC transporter substrate-binding protein [Bacillus cereus]MCU5156324.1 transporter substrate-binding domain-containing protein [Bacillus pac
MKKFLTFIIIGLLSILVVACGSNEKKTEKTSAKPSGKIEEIKERGELVVAVFTDKPPFGYVDKDGKNVGFEIDMAKRFAKDLLGDESKVKFVPVEAASRIPYLQSDKVDFVLANMTATDERKKVVDFTNPHLKVAVQVLVKDGSPIQSVKDLEGKKVIVTKGTTADIYLTKNMKNVELIKFDKNTEALQALKDGRADSYAQDNLVLLSWANKNPGFHLLKDKLGGDDLIAIAVKKGNKEVHDWVNKELEKLGKENFLHTLYDKHLKEEFGPQISPESVITEGGKVN